MARQWPARAAILISLLGVLGTSKPEGWSLKAVVSGPKSATTGGALKLEIDASAEPVVFTHGGPASYADGHVTPCLERFMAGTTLTCVLAPGTSLDDVEIHGSCGGCASGCPPPKGSFVNVKSSEVPYWTDTATADMTAVFPSHDKHWIATRLEVKVSGARMASVKLEVLDAATGGTISEQQQACTFEKSSSGLRGWCLFLVDDGLFKSKTNVHVVAHATGWDLCPPGHAEGMTCPAPKTLRIEGLDFAK